MCSVGSLPKAPWGGGVGNVWVAGAQQCFWSFTWSHQSRPVCEHTCPPEALGASLMAPASYSPNAHLEILRDSPSLSLVPQRVNSDPSIPLRPLLATPLCCCPHPRQRSFWISTVAARGTSLPSVLTPRTHPPHQSQSGQLIPHRLTSFLSLKPRSSSPLH